MPGFPSASRAGKRPADHGFTLLEIIVALVVIGMATSIFLSMYYSSLALADVNRSQIVAARLAEEFLAEIKANPESYTWPEYDAVAGDSYVLPLSTAQRIITPPEAKPPYERAFRRERNFYTEFQREARVIVPAKDAPYMTILVQIQWTVDGRNQYFLLTSALPFGLGEAPA